MSKHTPGPWMQGRTAPENVSAGGSLVCRAFPRSQWGGEQYANARLIAAAPDLLRALTNLERVSGLPSLNDDPSRVAARAAIAKAIGEQA